MIDFASLLEALQGPALLAAVVGAFLGTLVGVLPGLGPSTTMALLLPLTFNLEPLTALMLLAGVYYGSQYGGSTTAVLLNVPGEAGAEVTALEGYQMSRQGRAGPALTIAAVGSFVAGVAGLIALALLSPLLSDVALRFGPPEYFALTVLGLCTVFRVSSARMLKSATMAVLGLILGTVGLDTVSGASRFDLGTDVLRDGIQLVAVIMGMFGIAEVISNAGARMPWRAPKSPRLRELYASKEDLRRSAPPIVRGSITGFLMGLIPGPSTVMSTYVSYSTERSLRRRKLARRRAAGTAGATSSPGEEFGDGAIEGVAGPESANNGTVSSALIPLVSLGIPFSAPAAVLLAGFVVHGVTPGPQFMESTMFWSLIGAMLVGNLVLVVLNIPLVPAFVSILRVPQQYLLPGIVAIVVIGAFSISNSLFNVWLAVGAGIFGWFVGKLGYPPAPLVLGLVLGPIAERSFRQSLFLLSGDYTGFLTRPLSGTLLAIAALLLVGPLIYRAVRAARRTKDPDVARAGS